MLLECVKEEYKVENEKCKNFDVRVGITIPVDMAILLYIGEICGRYKIEFYNELI